MSHKFETPIQVGKIYTMKDGSLREVVKVKVHPYSHKRDKIKISYCVITPVEKTRVFANSVGLNYFKSLIIKM